MDKCPLKGFDEDLDEGRDHRNGKDELFHEQEDLVRVKLTYNAKRFKTPLPGRVLNCSACHLILIESSSPCVCQS